MHITHYQINGSSLIAKLQYLIFKRYFCNLFPPEFKLFKKKLKKLRLQCDFMLNLCQISRFSQYWKNLRLWQTLILSQDSYVFPYKLETSPKIIKSGSHPVKSMCSALSLSSGSYKLEKYRQHSSLKWFSAICVYFLLKKNHIRCFKSNVLAFLELYICLWTCHRQNLKQTNLTCYLD